MTPELELQLGEIGEYIGLAAQFVGDHRTSSARRNACRTAPVTLRDIPSQQYRSVRQYSGGRQSEEACFI
jgi:hypothetical protein